MADDLHEARACLTWVWRQFLSLDVRLEDWLARNVSIEIRDLPEPATHNAIVAFEKEYLSIEFSVEVGAYINTIRSSLDILAMSLARRYGHRVGEKGIDFPIVSNRQDLLRAKTRLRLLKILSDNDAAKFLSLKPYQNGNAASWALHRLDILRKHHRLLEVQIRPIHFYMEGAFASEDFQAIGADPFTVGTDTIIGLIRKGIPASVMKSTFYVAVNEPSTIKTHPVLGTMYYLAEAAKEAIDTFDRKHWS